MLTLQQEVIEFFSLKLVINSKKTPNNPTKKNPQTVPPKIREEFSATFVDNFLKGKID